MTTNKHKKVRKMRGSHTHGWGAKKKHRGKGHRGGKGMSGSGKRAGHKKTYILKYYGPEYFGKHGFTRPQNITKIRTINIADLPLTEHINLAELGYDKLLSTGTPKMKYTIIAKQSSKKAKEKIEQSGGKILPGTNHGTA